MPALAYDDSIHPALLFAVLLSLAGASDGETSRSDVLTRVSHPAGFTSVTVRARLDNEGVLHVAERQTLSTTGSTDGVVREMLRPIGSELRIREVRRVSPAPVTLRAGNLTRPDQYVLHTGLSHLLWRLGETRTEGTQVYEIDYTLTNALRLAPSGYVIEYDFASSALADRATIDLELDPVWKSVSGDPRSHGILQYTAAGTPRFAPSPVAESERDLVLIGIAAGFAALVIFFIVWQARAGLFQRHEQLPPFGGAPWIRRHILERFPELEQPGGAGDDRNVLATLVADRQAALRVGRLAQSIDFALLADREKLEPEQKKVVTILFGERAWFTSGELRRDSQRSAVVRALTTGWWHQLPVLLFAFAAIAAFVYAGMQRSEDFFYAGCFSVLVVMTMMIALMAVAIVSRSRVAFPLLFAAAAIVAAALPAAEAAAIVAQGQFGKTTALSVAVALFGLAAAALILNSARVSDGDLAERRTVLEAARIAARQLQMNRAVRSLNFVVTTDGFRPLNPNALFLKSLALALISGLFLVGWPAVPPPYQPLAGIVTIYLVFTLARTIRDFLRARRPVSTTLAAAPKGGRASPQVHRVRRDASQYPITAAEMTEGIAWEATAVYRSGDEDIEQHTIWHTAESAITGALEFWPRWGEVFYLPLLGTDETAPQWYLTIPALYSLGAGLAEIGTLRSVSRLPIDDDRLLTHYKVFSTTELGAQHISPDLRKVLIEFGESLHQRTRPSPALASMSLIMFWSRGLLIYSHLAAGSSLELKELARFGVRCARALRA